jgi:hypothetical protein
MVKVASSAGGIIQAGAIMLIAPQCCVSMEGRLNQQKVWCILGRFNITFNNPPTKTILTFPCKSG